jgi:preprotein translocase subunit YajC
MTLTMNTSLKSKTLSLLFFVSLVVGSTSLVYAEGPAVPAGSSAPTSAPSAPQQPGGLMAFAPFILMFVVLYFLVLRPQQKKMKDQQNMLSSLKHGDDVITASGLLGKVTGITEKVVTLEVADNVRVKMLKSQVSQVVKGNIKDLAQ